MDKKNFYGLFVGQNASYGQPNEQTGEYNFYGRVLCFKDAKDREHYIDNHQFNINETKIIKGGRQKMRKYCLGMSVNNFNQYLDSMDYE